jgi:hypothetical protein
MSGKELKFVFSLNHILDTVVTEKSCLCLMLIFLRYVTLNSVYICSNLKVKFVKGSLVLELILLMFIVHSGELASARVTNTFSIF